MTKEMPAYRPFEKGEPRVGDRVVRLLSETVPMVLSVTEIDDELIHCGPWTFNRQYGYEVDEDLGWGVGDDIITGSRLIGIATGDGDDASDA